ncbi:DUF397 domain-containing protein [Nocardia sp. 2]|uniref:DUF397 domain-containing protein n=1 Tax=Nocardia acididurans TaxID=2802282 RepID=A0ABS1M8Z5_9NOCA|nr:DUF397 domain-containing protein [Nocardia acididurans]MBL1077039.1 DUF397 domain-containing protein [Nocardia acididurans]
MNGENSAPRWFKSTHSGGTQDCVEIAHLAHGRVGIRDSKHPTGPALTFAAHEWDAFTASVKAGLFAR